MGGINSLSGLNKVNVDYRPSIEEPNVPKSTDANRPQPEPAVLPDDAQPPADAGARSVVRQLDVLLLNAAGKSVAADAATNVRTVGQSLVDKGVLSRKEASRLDSLAEDAAARLKALDRFSGRELAMALMQDRKTGETVWRGSFWGLNPAAKAVKAAIEAQQTLSAELGRFNVRLAENGQVGADLQDAFTELQFQCDRRASEIDSVVYRMYDLAQKDVAGGAAADPRNRALLHATFRELMPREAILMHGTAEAFEKLNAHLAAQMRPLAEKLDAFAANGSRALGREEILGLQRDMATMKNAIASVRANGIEVQGGRIEVDKSLLDAMERVLSDAAERIANAREIAVKRTRGAFLEELKAALSPENAPGGDKVMASSRYAGHPVLVEFRKARKDLVELIRDFAVGALPMDQFDARFNPCITKFRTGLFDNLELALLEVGFDAAASKQVAKTVRGLDYVKAQFKELMKSTEALRTGGEDPALATGDVRRLLLGENSLSSLVEAKARGFKPGDVDPAADDSNVVESKTLGSGAAGTTYLLTTKSGGKLVFKPELDSRIGLGDLMLGKGKAYANAQQTANLNLATQDTARAFGCEDVVVKYSVGSHNGQFGIFMEKAKGIPGCGFTRRSASGGGGIPPAELHRIADPAEQAKIKGAIARKLNQLMWLDLVTGQGDRHWGNYFVHIDRATHEVTVKGIDNDASFSALRIGLMKFALNKRQTSLFEAHLKNACQKIHGKGWEAEYNRCLNDPAIVRNGDTLTIDLAKAKSPEAKMAIIPTVGLQTIALPEEIDQDFYDHLLAMDGDTAARRAFLGSIAPRISPDALKAAEARLDEAIAHAKALKAKGKVYGTDQWQNQKNIAAMTATKASVTITKSNGGQIKATHEIECVRDYNERICPSFFKREFFHNMFNKPKQSA